MDALEEEHPSHAVIERLGAFVDATVTLFSADGRILGSTAPAPTEAIIEVTPEALTAEPGIVRDWQRACRAAGVFVRPLARGIASPAAGLRPEEIALLAGIGAALDPVGAATPAVA